jgi:hypothetical protein
VLFRSGRDAGDEISEFAEKFSEAILSMNASILSAVGGLAANLLSAYMGFGFWLGVWIETTDGILRHATN